MVQFALNDMFGGVGLDSFESALGEITQNILDAGAIPLLVTSSAIPIKPLAAMAATYYDVIRHVGQTTDAQFADLDFHWRTNAGPQERWGRLYIEDDTHPSDEGHALMAEGILALF